MATDLGNTFETATSFAITRKSKTVQNSVNATDKLDILSLNLKRKSYLNATLSRVARKAKADFFILDASRETIEFLSSSNNVVGQVNNVLLEKGTYYVAVQLQEGSAATRYSLRLSAVPTRDKFGNSLGTASLIPSQSITAATTFTAKDAVSSTDVVDVFRLSMPVAGRFQFDLSGLSQNADLAIYNIVNGNLNRIKSSANPGTENEQIKLNLNTLVNSTYYIAVTPGTPLNANYTLRYSFVPKASVTTPSGLRYITLKPGTGATPQRGQTVTVQYTGVLENGIQFDSSRDRNQPFSFKVGLGEVIEGWDEAFSTMRVGERRQLIIPANLGYGPNGTRSIPPNATLIFDVEVLSISP